MFEPKEFRPGVQTYNLDENKELGNLGISFEIRPMSEAHFLRFNLSPEDVRLQKAFEFGVVSISGMKFQGRSISTAGLFLATMELTDDRKMSSILMMTAAKIIEITLPDKATEKNS